MPTCPMKKTARNATLALAASVAFTAVPAGAGMPMMSCPLLVGALGSTDGNAKATTGAQAAKKLTKKQARLRARLGNAKPPARRR